MIADYTNPHGREIEPKSIEEMPTIERTYRVVRMYGVFIVQYYNEEKEKWYNVFDELYEKQAKYPTIQEAENFICRHRKPEIYYYY
jgi:hypothetical protein